MVRSRSSSPNPANQQRGYKAALHNPRVSQSAKNHAQEMLEGQSNELPPNAPSEGGKYGSQPVQTSRGDQASRTNVVRGLKAVDDFVSKNSATHNQQNTDFGRAQARSKLEDMGQNPDE